MTKIRPGWRCWILSMALLGACSEKEDAKGRGAEVARTAEAEYEEKITAKEEIALRQMLRKRSVAVTARVSQDKVKSGSGFVYDRLGERVVVLTNAHVIRRENDPVNIVASEIMVTPPGRKDLIPAQLLHMLYDPSRNEDFALLVARDPGSLFGNKVEIDLTFKPRKGTFIMAVGNPQDEEFLTDDGVVVRIEDKDRVSLIYHSALTEAGSSGGGLFNRKGELVGLTTYLAADKKTGIAVDIRSILNRCRVYDFKVKSGTEWQKSDIMVAAGDRIVFLSDGDVEYPSGLMFYKCTPYGVAGFEEYRMVKKFNYSNLLARIGTGEPFSAADKAWKGAAQAWGKALGDVTADSPGVLSFVINGTDSKGSFELTTLVIKKD